MEAAEVGTKTIRVAVFETHPAVRAGLVRRLEAEPDVEVIGVYSQPENFAIGISRHSPDVAVIGMFGSGGLRAARMADVRLRRNGTRLLAFVPGIHTREASGLPPSTQVIEDGPRGDRVVAAIQARRSS